jgi:hypothetical protein
MIVTAWKDTTQHALSAQLQLWHSVWYPQMQCLHHGSASVASSGIAALHVYNKSALLQ